METTLVIILVIIFLFFLIRYIYNFKKYKSGSGKIYWGYTYHSEFSKKALSSIIKERLWKTDMQFYRIKRIRQVDKVTKFFEIEYWGNPNNKEPGRFSM